MVWHIIVQSQKTKPRNKDKILKGKRIKKKSHRPDQH
jgi:hypothetical protein